MESITTANGGNIVLQRNSNGAPLKTIDNFLTVMREDPAYSNIRFNVLKSAAELHKKTTKGISIERWSDCDEAKSRNYIETVYGLYNERKHSDALRILFHEREYNPIMDIIDNLKWDGTERCEEFLVKWAKAEDTPYNREVSRLIFAGGIWRLYCPGCKFDDVPVLVGEQGAGKSSIVRWLAINDRYYGEIKDVEGAQGIEQLEGKFVLEIAELAAFTKQKQVEGIKAYITRQCDQYRRPYDRQTTELPRRCVFVGTSNTYQFLVDLSGNRRFYPVQTGLTRQNGYELYDAEDECREYILQCWAEAREKYNRGEMPNFARRDLVESYAEAQDNAMQDDWRVGAIESYLAEKAVGDFVCVKQIKDEVLSANIEFPKDVTPIESKEIGIIMSRMPGWNRSDKRKFTPRYGQQRGWVKAEENPQKAEFKEIKRKEAERIFVENGRAEAAAKQKAFHEKQNEYYDLPF